MEISKETVGGLLGRAVIAKNRDGYFFGRLADWSEKTLTATLTDAAQITGKHSPEMFARIQKTGRLGKYDAVAMSDKWILTGVSQIMSVGGNLT